MHEYINTNINKEIWVVMELLVQKSVRCILSGEEVVACDIFLIGGQPYVPALSTIIHGVLCAIFDVNKFSKRTRFGMDLCKKFFLSFTPRLPR